MAVLLLLLAMPMRAAGPDPALPDLDVGWISRAPVLDYVENPVDPRRDGWPEPGSQVTWIAHVRNWGSIPTPAVRYQWLINGELVGSGTVDLPADGYATAELARPWSFQREDLTFVIDPDQKVEESEEQNNSLTVQTDALSVGFYVEQSVYDYFHQFQREMKVGSNSWEDAEQRFISQANTMFAKAISPDTPHGVLDRWRIDELVVVPDGALPLGTGGQPARMPNSNDRTVDLTWGFPATVLQGTTYSNHTSGTIINPFFFDGGTLHEMGHVRYLLDVYAFTIRHDGVAAQVNIEEKGSPVVGTPLMPVTRNRVVYATFETGLMNETYTKVDHYSAAALNQIAGYRARGGFGNTIFNENVAIFIKKQFPARQRIRLVDPAGNPLSGAAVRYYKAERGPLVDGGPFGQQNVIRYNDAPDLTLTADSDGWVTVDGDPFRKTGETALLTGVSILRVQKPGAPPSFVYLEATAVNRAYWRGQTDTASYELVVGGSPCNAVVRLTSPSEGASVRRAESVSLSWEKVPGATSYLVWAATDGQPPEPVGSTTGTSLDYVPPGQKTEWFVEVQFNQCLGTKSGLARFSVQSRGRAVVR